MFKDNKYTKCYNDIIIKARSQHRNKKDYYFENHHIIPKSCGGDNKKENLVLLTAKEHFICHLLLAKMCINPAHHLSMIRAWNIMVVMHSNSKKRLTSKLFSNLKQQYAEISRQRRLGKKHSIQTRNKISQNHHDVSGKNNPNYGKTTSLETIEKIKANTSRRRGIDHYMFGTKLSDERKALISSYGKLKWNDDMKMKLKLAHSIGTLHTPWGSFISAKDAAKNCNSKYKDPSTIIRKCRDINELNFSLVPA